MADYAADECKDLGTVIRRTINTNLELNFNLIKLNFLFKVLFLNSKLALTLGYLNPALNDPVISDVEACVAERLTP